MPDLNELIKRIGGKTLLMPPETNIRKRPAIISGDDPQYAGQLPVITQAMPSAVPMAQSGLPMPSMQPGIADKPRLQMPQIIPVASDAKETALPETGRPGALENLPIPQFNAPIPNLDEPPPKAANGIGGDDFKQQLSKIVLGALRQNPQSNTTPGLQEPTARRPRIAPD